MERNFLSGIYVGATMTFKAKKCTDIHDHKEPGTWKELIMEGGEISATFTCPKCGMYGSLEDHEVTPAGEVSPSVECSNSCGFHEFIVLEEWLGINGAHLTNIM